jgi:hypothetical protein
VTLRELSHEDLESLGRAFRSHSDLGCVVLEDFLVAPQTVSDAFPEASWTCWNALGDRYQHNKFSCQQIDLFPQDIRNVFYELAAPKFLMQLEKITGIDGLIPDPYLEGGGLHLSTGGGVLAPHTDFHIYNRLGLYRRINLIVYLNSAWRPGDGGELELSLPEDSQPSITVSPTLGRTVIFETNDRSIHGFPNEVRNGTERKSLAVYYYTTTETARFSGDQTTHWRIHPTVSFIQMPRFYLYKGLLKISRLFSIMAQVINPNQGLNLLKARLRKR